MSHWKPLKKHMRGYPHFDSLMALEQIEVFANDAMAVEKHAFFPFILYEKKWQPFRGKSPKPPKKIRPIRYAARGDAYIFMRYRQLLSELYEQQLHGRGISDCILAYRRIPVGNGKRGGKCNIHFAKDAFETIREFGNCAAVVLDVSSYFESLDHARLKATWLGLIDQQRMPADHWQVFKAVTSYSVVDREKVYTRLGYFGEKRRTKTGRPINGFLRPLKKMPSRLCSLKDFKDKVIGGDSALPSLIEVNGRDFGKPGTGIPQGSPISDVLANIYLIDFDCRVNERVTALGGVYRRYSDDILLILPGDASVALEAKEWIMELIREYGGELQIKDSKTSVAAFTVSAGKAAHHWVAGKGKNGLEYLGFRFDGQRVFLRDGTLSGLARKISRVARIEATRFASRYPGKDLDWLLRSFHYEVLIKRFGRVEDFEELDDLRKWTFWTYVQRASQIFGLLGRRIIPQVSGHNGLIQRRAKKAIEEAFLKRAMKL